MPTSAGSLSVACVPPLTSTACAHLRDFESRMWGDDSKLCCRLRWHLVVVDRGKPACMVNIIIYRLSTCLRMGLNMVTPLEIYT